MLRKSFALLLIAVLVMTLVVGCGGGAQKEEPVKEGEEKKEEVKAETLKMSVTTAEGSSWTKGAEKFAQLVEEKTGGKLKVKVYTNEQLSGGNQGKGIEMLMNGATDLSFHSNIIYSIMDERFGVISLPWLLPSYEIADAKIQGEGGEKFAQLLLEKNVVALDFGENGFRQITNNVRPIANPADIEGLKIRIPGIKMYISLFKALGADPTAMNFAEVFTSLQQGAIDGQENPLDVIYSSKLYEVQKHISLWNYSYDAIILGMNKDKFESYDADTQKALREAAEEACAFQRELNRKNGEEQLKFFQEKGMTVTELTEEQIKAFQEKVQPVYDEYEPIVGKELLDLFR